MATRPRNGDTTDKMNSNDFRGRPAAEDANLPRLQRIPTYLQPPLSFVDRLQHFTFAWFTVTMSTSGVALILAITPHRFRGLDIIGLVVFLLDLVFFVFITVAIILRFIWHRPTFRRSFTHPTEALFIPTFCLSIAAILSNLAAYGALFLDQTGRDGLAKFLGAAFWIYLSVTFVFSVFEYHLLFTVKPEHRLNINAMTPAWILPIFPVMLAGTLAGAFSPTQPADQSLAMLCAGLAAQGLGLFISVFNYSTYISRLMTLGLPSQRPGMFIAVGPPSFTCAALVSMASDVPRIFASKVASSEVSALAGSGNLDTLAAGIYLLALSASIFLWGLSFWFLCSAIAAVIGGLPDTRFHLSWWSFVFPNVGFTIATIRLGDALGNDGLLWFATVMTVLLVLAWLFIGVQNVRAVWSRQILWPGHDEDTD